MSGWHWLGYVIMFHEIPSEVWSFSQIARYQDFDFYWVTWLQVGCSVPDHG